MKKRNQAILIVFSTFLLQSCTSYIQKPMVTKGLNDADGMTIVSTSASRRANFVSDLNRAKFICMEPQPDVREDIAKAFLAAVAAEAKQTDTEKGAKASGNISNISSMLTAQLNRSISIEYLKASLFALCQQKYNQYAVDPKGKPRRGFEADDFHQIGERAMAIAISEIIYGNKKASDKPAKSPTDEMNNLSKQLQQIQDSVNKINASSAKREIQSN